MPTDSHETPFQPAAYPSSAGPARLTKIVATLGPASSSAEVIAQLVADGVDVFRLNFSHGSHAEHAVRIDRIRRASDAAERKVAILQDLGGPKIRTGRLVGGQAIELRAGERLVLAVGDFEGGPGRVALAYEPLAACVRPGDRLLLDDGSIELQVRSADGKEIVTTVATGGFLGERKGINLPGVELPAAGLTDKDVEDLRFGVASGVDFLAISFVRSPDDVRRGREAALDAGGTHVRLIVKIERPEALECLDELLDVCDGVMVARGDLGLEIPLESVPGAQKRITRSAIARGLPVIIATQVLDSMQRGLRPTRAEVSDAANAVEDRVDAIMLSGETAVGAHPAHVVRTLDAVIRDAEANLQPGAVAPLGAAARAAHVRALCEAASTLVREAPAAAMVAISRQGRTAALLSGLRMPVPVIAAVPDDRLARQLALRRAVTPVPLPGLADPGADFRFVDRELVSRGIVSAGSVVVFVRLDSELGDPLANHLRIGIAGTAS
jgi:pyruvate kinase